MPPPATLDNRTYPHIFETILSHADNSVLCAFRATGRGPCERATALLYRHIVALWDDRSARSSAVLRSPSGARLPIAPIGDPRSYSGDALPHLEPARLARVLAHVKVCDVMCTDMRCEVTDDFAFFTRAIPPDAVVRLFQFTTPITIAGTYDHMGSLSRNLVICHTELPFKPDDDVVASECEIRADMHVVHVSYHTQYPLLNHIEELYLPALRGQHDNTPPSSVVFHFAPLCAGAPASTANAAHVSDGMPEPLGLLGWCPPVLMEVRGSAVTFVGLNDIHPDAAIPCLTGHESEAWATRREILAGHLVEEMRGWAIEPDNFEPPTMSFPTVNEYIARAGPARYDLETAPPPCMRSARHREALLPSLNM